MKKIFVTLSMATLCVGLAAPALAKGPGEQVTESSATIEGRGLAAPIRLTSDRDCGVVFPCSSLADLDDPLVNLATLTGVGFRRPSYARPNDVSPLRSEGLGPRYTITYTVTFGDGVARTLVQDVYPWAGAHGWIYTPKGQHAFEGEIAGGWTPAPTTLRAALIDLGVPASPPPAVAAPVADTPTAADPVPVIGLTSLMFLLLMAAGVIIARTRKTTRPAITL